MKATATANANIALVKYWGKRDSKLLLPQNSSVSMTCSGLCTTTTVEFSDGYQEDIIVINDEELWKDEKNIRGHLGRIREIARIKQYAKIVSESNFPVAAGLASSASGFAALTLAAADACGLHLNQKELTILTRLGSGSACRSVCEGFVEWHSGHRLDGLDSYAETIANKNHWPEFRIIAAIVSESKKKVSSRAGMKQTVETCPYYNGWLATVDKDLEIIKDSIKRTDFSSAGATAEMNCLKMHALMITTYPPIIYWIPATIEVMHAVQEMRSEGLQAYFTIDAGPQVKVMCLEKDEKEINRRLMELEGVKKTIVCSPGDGAKLIDSHLF
jgi:diphosphomevalonate decarboxylase